MHKKAINNLAKAIKEERKSQGLNQTELAELAGVSLNFLSQLEGGKESVQLSKLLQVLITLGIELKIGYGKKGISQ